MSEEIPADVAEAQHARWTEQLRTCASEPGYSDFYAWDRWNPDQVTALYEREVEAYRCIVAAGHEVSPPPSLPQYLETFPGAGQYFAIEKSGSLPENELSELVRQCPPPTW